MVPRRPPTLLRGLVCMTDFLFAVIAGLLFLTIEVNQEAQAMRSKSTPPPDSAVAVAGTEVRLRALETSAQELKSDLAGLAKVVADRSREVTNSNAPAKLLPKATTK